MNSIQRFATRTAICIFLSVFTLGASPTGCEGPKEAKTEAWEFKSLGEISEFEEKHVCTPDRPLVEQKAECGVRRAYDEAMVTQNCILWEPISDGSKTVRCAKTRPLVEDLFHPNAVLKYSCTTSSSDDSVKRKCCLYRSLDEHPFEPIFGACSEVIVSSSKASPPPLLPGEEIFIDQTFSDSSDVAKYNEFLSKQGCDGSQTFASRPDCSFLPLFREVESVARCKEWSADNFFQCVNVDRSIDDIFTPPPGQSGRIRVSVRCRSSTHASGISCNGCCTYVYTDDGVYAGCIISCE